MYGIVTAFVIPFSIVAIIYSAIVCRARQSTRRVMPCVTTVSGNANVHRSNMGREMVPIRNMSILLAILLGGGIPYLIVVLWHAIEDQHPPESFYLLTINSISICTALMIFALFSFNKQVKESTLKYVL
jgi:hypothetical protein